MIETHAHIYDSQFDSDRETMLENAFSAGVEQIWMPNCNSKTIGKMLEIEANYPDKCFPMIGLHPCYVDKDYDQEMAVIEQWLKERQFKMIGEIGLDFYWDLSFVPQQEEAFLQQLALAKQYNLPICIHSRNSKDNAHNAIIRCCELIEEFGWSDLKGIFHCFSGNLEEAKRVISLNFFLGIGGVATFKNGGLDAVLPYVSLDTIVLETDAPYLAPVPHRGKRNEPAFLPLVVEKLALYMGSSPNEIIERTTQNAKRLLPY